MVPGGHRSDGEDVDRRAVLLDRERGTDDVELDRVPLRESRIDRLDLRVGERSSVSASIFAISTSIPTASCPRTAIDTA